MGAGPGQRDQWRDAEKGRGWENQTSSPSLELSLQWGYGPRAPTRSLGRVPRWLSPGRGHVTLCPPPPTSRNSRLPGLNAIRCLHGHRWARCCRHRSAWDPPGPGTLVGVGGVDLSIYM